MKPSPQSRAALRKPDFLRQFRQRSGFGFEAGSSCDLGAGAGVFAGVVMLEADAQAAGDGIELVVVEPRPELF